MGVAAPLLTPIRSAHWAAGTTVAAQGLILAAAPARFRRT